MARRKSLVVDRIQREDIESIWSIFWYQTWLLLCVDLFLYQLARGAVVAWGGHVFSVSLVVGAPGRARGTRGGPLVVHDGYLCIVDGIVVLGIFGDVEAARIGARLAMASIARESCCARGTATRILWFAASFLSCYRTDSQVLFTDDSRNQMRR